MNLFQTIDLCKPGQKCGVTVIGSLGEIRVPCPCGGCFFMNDCDKSIYRRYLRLGDKWNDGDLVYPERRELCEEYSRKSKEWQQQAEAYKERCRQEARWNDLIACRIATELDDDD